MAMRLSSPTSLLLFAVFGLICTPLPTLAPSQEKPSPHRLSREQISRYISQYPEGVTFVSRNGQMYGMDSDAEVVLKSTKEAAVTEFGYTARRYTA